MAPDVDPLLAMIEQERVRRGWKPRQLSYAAGLTDTSYSCTLAAGNCTLATLRALLRALDLDLFVRTAERPQVRGTSAKAKAEQRLSEHLAAQGMPSQQIPAVVARAQQSRLYQRRRVA